MTRLLLPACALALLAACTDEATPPAEPEEAPERNEPAREVILGSDGNPAAFKPDPSRDPRDPIAGCEGSMRTTRPRGSNCAGIYPEQCGADRAQRHRGELLTDALRQAIIAYSPAGDVRFYRRGEGMDADLRIGRLNVELDESQRIVATDCF